MAVRAAFMVPHPPMIIPAVGRGSEKQIQKTAEAYERVADEIAAVEPETIIISSPHATMYSDYFHISPGLGAKGDFGRFRAPEVKFAEEYDRELVSEISEIARLQGFPAGVMGERDRSLDHGTMVPLYFIRRVYSGGKIVRIGLSGLSLADHYRLGQVISQAADRTGRRVVYVASGDLSHKLQDYGPYGFAKEGPIYEERVMNACAGGNFGELLEFDEVLCEKAAECGHRSLVIMAGTLDGLSVKAGKLSHEDVTGVGYGICTFYPGKKDEDRHFLDQYLMKAWERLAEKKAKEDPYVQLARQSVEHYILHHRKMEMPEDLPRELTATRAGTFVSIHEHGKLRGCIGTISPMRECVAEEIIDNAVGASVRDPRFEPIRADELDWLEISVDVLGEPEPVKSVSELDAKRYGVIVSKGRKRGLLLPDLDKVDTAQQQIAIAKSKAGISEWDDKVELQRFEVVRHH